MFYQYWANRFANTSLSLRLVLNRRETSKLILYYELIVNELPKVLNKINFGIKKIKL